jgi:hypothetical protein
MSPGVRILAVGFVALSVVLAGCYVEEQFIFFPSAEISRTPRNYGLAFDEVYFEAEDGVTPETSAIAPSTLNYFTTT